MENQNQTQDIWLDRKSRIFFLIFALLIAGSVAVTFYRYIIARDYNIQAQIDCDPETENCFIWECDPGSLEEGEKCTGVPDNDTWYYKILSRNAKNIPDCDPKDENCTAYVCVEGEKDCSYELCAPENVPDDEECNDPEQYLLENPPEEEECAEDDEECLAEEETLECDEETGECEELDAAEECAEDDEECLADEAEECDPESEDCTASEGAEENIPSDESSEAPQTDARDYVLPAGVEPM